MKKVKKVSPYFLHGGSVSRQAKSRAGERPSRQLDKFGYINITGALTINTLTDLLAFLSTSVTLNGGKRVTH